MRGFDHATILSPSFHGLRKERLAQWPAFCVPKIPLGTSTKIGRGCALLETLTLFQTKICDFPYPISDLIKNLIPYFRPEAPEPGAWPEHETSPYGTYTVGVNIKREMVLSPNDEEFKTIPYFRPKWSKLIPCFRPKRLKTIPFSAAHTYMVYMREYPTPPHAKNALQIMSFAAYPSETNKGKKERTIKIKDKTILFSFSQ